ncbi:unnamed protein product [Periconia digitata]|uniref:DNA repair protein RAD16 n=1 Tax=Periconia digitata TaxID=1303443 RepID=A0A9W4UG23_9PLEO|nr:unnamed protein product [Periconia digitata]
MPPRRSSRKSVVEDTASLVGANNDVMDAPNTRSNSRSTAKRTRASLRFVPNSSEDEDESVDPDPPKRTSLPIRRVLKEVAIPSKMANKSNDTSTRSPSTVESDYETPDTSHSATPVIIARGRKSTRKSGLNQAVNASLSSSSSRKRPLMVVNDTDEEADEDDLVEDLAMQIQLEEGMRTHKRQKVTPDAGAHDNAHDTSPPQKKQTQTFVGKGKGKEVALDQNAIANDTDSSSVGIPTYKGKGKARVGTTGGPSLRSSAMKTHVSIGSDDDLTDDLSDPATDLSLDSSSLELIESSSSEDESVVLPIKRPQPKASRGKPKKKTRAEKAENAARRARFAHIHDKWERKRAMNRERAEQSHPKLTTMWKTLSEVPVLCVEQIAQPTTINRRLKPFQLEGVSWMIRQEKTQYKGGLLGDEMGMGKTIQAVSLIMSDFPAKSPTLVLVPPVALLQWSNEISEYTDGKLKVLVYHGTNAKCKKMTVKDLKKFDVIMVSYNSLESLHRKETKGWTRGEDIIKEASPLHAIHYHRLILDEAHSIKSRTTGVAKACFALKGTYKWCLSGTPVQNRIGEFFSLLRFLEVRPFADYFCRSCDCEQLHWSVDDDHMCTACNHGASEHISVFNQELLNPITGDDPELREDALTKLHMITARIMLRRMKRDHTNSMELPMKDIVIHNEFFSEIERDFSSSIMSNSARKFDTYVAQGVMLNNYANIFGLIMQMRQVANHPDLLLKKNAAEGSQNVYVCNICDEPAEDAIRSRCHHEFCRACVKDFVETCEASGTDADCPRCHIALSIDFEQPELEQDEESVKKTSIINRIKMENWTSSTKIEMLVYDLYKLRSKKQTLKSIVFSQFTSMLQLIEWRLRRAGFNTVMLDGSMTPAQRQKSIEHFMTNSDVEVFLVSLKAGGVALNLTEASRVFIVDPWWNPAAEWQSADRCHRIGQKRPCVITRLCIEDSVESRMVALQEKKAAMIAGTVNNDKVAMDRLSPEDLQFLFRGT